MKSRPHRKESTGSCPVLGRPRFFRITTFESDMRHVLQQSAHTGNPSLRISSPCICRVGGCLTVARATGPVRQRMLSHETCLMGAVSWAPPARRGVYRRARRRKPHFMGTSRNHVTLSGFQRQQRQRNRRGLRTFCERATRRPVTSSSPLTTRTGSGRSLRFHSRSMIPSIRAFIPAPAQH